MAKIISAKRKYNERMQYKIELTPGEALYLKGSIKNINFFCEDLFQKKTSIVKRGREGSSQYFQIPFELRFKKNLKIHTKMTYQKIETKRKSFYIYVINKSKVEF